MYSRCSLCFAMCPITISLLPSTGQYDVHCTYVNTVAKAHVFFSAVLIFIVHRFHRSFLFLMTLGIPAHVDTHSAFEDGIISISLGSQVRTDYIVVHSSSSIDGFDGAWLNIHIHLWKATGRSACSPAPVLF